MTQLLKKKHKNFLSWLLVTILATLILTGFSTSAQVFESSIVQPFLPLKLNQQEGQVVLKGSKGQYTGKVVVKGSIATTWAVLTDYDHFKDFMPNVVESRLLESKGNLKVFEQVQIFQLLLVQQRGRVKLAVTETHPKQIKFRAIEGDVKSLEGSWQIEPISSNLFLLTHQVSVEPKIKSDFNRNLFFAIYEDTLENTLKAVQEEIGKRTKTP